MINFTFEIFKPLVDICQPLLYRDHSELDCKGFSVVLLNSTVSGRKCPVASAGVMLNKELHRMIQHLNNVSLSPSVCQLVG